MKRFLLLSLISIFSNQRIEASISYSLCKPISLTIIYGVEGAVGYNFNLKEKEKQNQYDMFL